MYLCAVPNFIESYHERRRERPNETLATLCYKEGATFYLIQQNVFKIDNAKYNTYFSKTFPDNLQYSETDSVFRANHWRIFAVKLTAVVCYVFYFEPQNKRMAQP